MRSVRGRLAAFALIVASTFTVAYAVGSLTADAPIKTPTPGHDHMTTTPTT